MAKAFVGATAMLVDAHDTVREVGLVTSQIMPTPFVSAARTLMHLAKLK